MQVQIEKALHVSIFKKKSLDWIIPKEPKRKLIKNNICLLLDDYVYIM